MNGCWMLNYLIKKEGKEVFNFGPIRDNSIFYLFTHQNTD
jgi:hypothetical protein